MKKKLADRCIKNLFSSYLLKKNYEKLVFFVNKEIGCKDSLVGFLKKFSNYSFSSEYLRQRSSFFDNRVSDNILRVEQAAILTDKQCEVLASLFINHVNFGDDQYFYDAYVDTLLKQGLGNITGDELFDILAQPQIKYFDYRLYNSVVNSNVKNKTFNSVKTCCVIS